MKLYAEKHGLPLEVYFDRKGTATDAYDAAATSYVVVVDKTGTVVYTGLGGSQNLEAAIKKALGNLTRGPRQMASPRAAFALREQQRLPPRCRTVVWTMFT